MVSEEGSKCEHDIWSFENISFSIIFKEKKKNEKYIFMGIKQSLLDQVNANYC